VFSESGIPDSVSACAGPAIRQARDADRVGETATRATSTPQARGTSSAGPIPPHWATIDHGILTSGAPTARGQRQAAAPLPGSFLDRIPQHKAAPRTRTRSRDELRRLVRSWRHHARRRALAPPALRRPGTLHRSRRVRPAYHRSTPPSSIYPRGRSIRRRRPAIGTIRRRQRIVASPAGTGWRLVALR